MSRHTRRTFLKQTAAAGAAAAFTIAGTKASGRVLGANDTVRVAVAGLNSRGRQHLQGYLGLKGVEVVALADPDRSLFASRSATVEAAGGPAPKCVEDIRKLLDRKDVDAVSIATPNHWHTLMTVWAAQAGKDVYVEKPCSHNLVEGRRCVEAAAKYGRIVQHGTQQRSSPQRAAEIAAVHSGKWGKLRVSKTVIGKPRWSIGSKPISDPPPTLDFDLWLGPAAKQPFHKNLVHYNWHWFWDFGDGEIGNQGIHELDVAHWAIAGATLPTKVWSLGGRFAYQDQGETPNMDMAVFEFGDVLLVAEIRGLVNTGKGVGSPGPKLTEPTLPEAFVGKLTNEFHTSEGVIRNAMLYPKGGGPAVDLHPEPVPVTPGGTFGSFIECVRSRRREAVNAPILAGHYSSALAHLANISYRLGREVPFSHEPEGMSVPEIAETFETIKANLKAVGVDLQKTNYRLGRVLSLDPKTEQFVGDDEANAMRSRRYRPPFVVPESV